ncbi:MAG: NADH-quinone oxidoreductase subunit F, partial [Anaerolineae bacterium]|nr:NADH-quinone oxidoreductase subunit F [Anaerolineae bacterium]
MDPLQGLAARRSAAKDGWEHRTIGADLYVTVGMGTCGIAAGAEDAVDAIRGEAERRGLRAEIGRVGCVGMCSYEPMIELQAHDRGRMNYGQATADNIAEIFAAYYDGGSLSNAVVVGEVVPDATVHSGHLLHTLAFVHPKRHDRIPFQQKQLRVVLSNCGLIDPESLDDYLAMDGYSALEKALCEMTPEAVIDELIKSGLRGRGGGGFSTGTKWKLARQTQKWPKYVICNADEGDPGAFMDRSTLEGDPHSLIEGMILAGYAIGAQTGFIYCRAEYPLAISRLERALTQARGLGLLGERILGTEFSFDIHVKEGAGAFVCGEETALMASIQGERGQPWPRPPYPAVAGLWGQPSNVNNVKSYAYAPRIIRLGADWFRSLGTEGSPGTAVFALSGMVNRTGLIEIPMGVTLGEIIYEIGGGVPDGR